MYVMTCKVFSLSLCTARSTSKCTYMAHDLHSTPRKFCVLPGLWLTKKVQSPIWVPWSVCIAMVPVVSTLERWVMNHVFLIKTYISNIGIVHPPVKRQGFTLGYPGLQPSTHVLIVGLVQQIFLRTTRGKWSSSVPLDRNCPSNRYH